MYFRFTAIELSTHINSVDEFELLLGHFVDNIIIAIMMTVYYCICILITLLSLDKYQY